MLDTLKLQLTFPTGAYAPATTYNALKRGDGPSSAQYVLSPADVLAATSSEVAQALATYNLARRSPGQRGTNRSQALVQFAIVNASGGVDIVSVSTVVARPNSFVAAAGTTVDVDKLTRAAVAANASMLLNPDADTTTPRAQSSVTDLFCLGVLP